MRSLVLVAVGAVAAACVLCVPGATARHVFKLQHAVFESEPYPEAVWANPCDADPLKSSKACDTALSVDERVDALMAFVTDDMKPGLLVNGAAKEGAINLPAYQWWSEALHGVGRSPGVTFDSETPFATSFPQVITTGASFNKTLFLAIGTAVGTEARAFNNKGHAGLTFWAPNVNIYRDPRWGRGQETPGEDPTLNTDYAATFPYGMQSGESWPKYIKASSCCKHYAAYNLEDWGGVDRHHFNAVVDGQDLNDTYFVPFQSCVQRAKASGIMCSYNAVNGVPSCASPDLLNKQLRGAWGFDGYVTSDCGAVADVMENHKYTATADDTCAVTLTAGMDSDCGGFLSTYLGDCISDGHCNASVTDPALKNLFRVQMRLGLFDPADSQPYHKIGMDQVNTREHQQLALDAAIQGIVMLKNANSRLPLSKSVNNVAVIGPNANATTVLQGNYEGQAPYLISPIAGITEYAAGSQYIQGCDVECKDTAGFAAATAAAAKADAVVVVVGLDQSQESEGHDRTTITLPGNQEQLIKQVCASAKAPIVLVVMSGGSLDITSARDADCVGAILWVGYPGQSGGTAIARIMFGDASPGGRLPQTIYPADFVNQVSMFDMGMRPNKTSGNPGRSHRFYTGTPVYAFGDGLSFTTFQYSWTAAHLASSGPSRLSALSVAQAVDATHNDLTAELGVLLSLGVNVCNTGAVAGDEVVLVFVHPPEEQREQGAPIRQLRLFERVHAAPGECVGVDFGLTARDFAFAGLDGAMVSPVGAWQVRVGQPTQLVHDVLLA